jgi:hypothetical protein
MHSLMPLCGRCPENSMPGLPNSVCNDALDVYREFDDLHGLKPHLEDGRQPQRMETWMQYNSKNKNNKCQTRKEKAGLGKASSQSRDEGLMR